MVERGRDLIKIVKEKPQGKIKTCILGMKIEFCGNYVWSGLPASLLEIHRETGSLVHWVYLCSEVINGGQNSKKKKKKR